MNLVTDNVLNREHILVASETINFAFTDGAKKIKFSDTDVIKDAFIIGLAIRKQNAGGTKVDYDGIALANDATIARSFLVLKKSDDLVQQIPLEFFLFDSMVHGPGQYAQLILPEGFKEASCEILIVGGSVGAGSFEFTFFHAPYDNCKLIVDKNY